MVVGNNFPSDGCKKWFFDKSREIGIVENLGINPEGTKSAVPLALSSIKVPEARSVLYPWYSPKAFIDHEVYQRTIKINFINDYQFNPYLQSHPLY